MKASWFCPVWYSSKIVDIVYKMTRISVRAVVLAMSATTAGAADLVISVGTQNGFFQSDPKKPTQSGDIGPMK